jgi:hypothetical protein
MTKRRTRRRQDKFFDFLIRPALGSDKWLSGVYIDQAFPVLRLKDEQWSKIAKLSDIPEDSKDARREIEIALGMFRQFQASDSQEMLPADIREELRTLANDAGSLTDRLSRLIEDRNAYEAIIGGRVFNRELLWQLANLHPEWFLRAADRVEDRKRGPKAENVYWLVGNLDGIRERYAAKKITRSYKDAKSKEYITYVCKIADPAMGDGTIDGAMKEWIKTRIKRGY